jgi:hypothetical protein
VAVRPRELRTDAGAAYIYTGLGNPVIGASVSQDWDHVGTITRTAIDNEPLRAELLERERSASLVATFTRPRFRSFSWLSLGLGARQRDYTLTGTAPGFAVPDLPAEAGGAATLGYSTSRRYEYSVSPENGFAVAGSVEGRRYLDAIGDDESGRGYLRTTGRAQHYLPFNAWGYARHVLGLRVAGGADRGAFTPGYTIGGTGGGVSAFPLSTFVSLGAELDLPVRGYADGTQFGDRAAAGTLEWRFPVALVQRGYRVMPIYLDRVWGTAFVDAGRTWCSADCLARAGRGDDLSTTLASAGAELGLNLSLSYVPPFPVRAGIGIPLLAVNVATEGGFVRERPEPRAYLTFGLSF